MSTSHSKDYWIISAFMFTLFVAYSFVYAMYAIWLSQAVDLSGEKIGIIFSFNAVAAIVSQPLLGFIQDKIQARQHILWLNVITLIAAGPFLNLVYKPLLLSDFYLGVVVGSAYIALAFLAIAGAVETYIERISRFNHLEYGQIRTWGSLGWATAAFFTGRLINIDVDLNFWMASVISLIPLFILVVIKIPVSEKAAQAFSVADKITVKDIVGVLKLRNFQYLTLFVFGVAAIYVVYDQQFPVYFAAVFPTVEEGNKMYGYLNSAQIFLEAGGFFVAPWLINKIGPKNGLLLAGAIIVVRIASSGLTDSPLLISLIKLMHAAELPILMVAMFKYLNKHFDSHLSSTLYILGFTFVTQVGTVTLSPLAGIYYDTIGFEKTYFIMAG
ncbi:MAG: oligosaccharide MFS transporter, partial [Exilibacterium sp.]